MLKRIIILILLNISLYGNIQNADDISFVDDITINGREFESLEQRTIEFYEEDLKNGKIIIQGLLESTDKNVDTKDLFVEITRNGGKSWKRASGHKDWEFSFEPKIGFTYEFSLRVVKVEREKEDTNLIDQNIRTFYIAGFKLELDESAIVSSDIISGSGILTIPYLESFNINSELPVTFDNLSFNADEITLGDIEYIQPIVINTEIADISISKIVISGEEANNKVEGNLQFNGFLNSLPSLSLSDSSKFLQNKFSLDIPISNEKIEIFKEKNVSLNLNSGFININYLIGAQHPSLDLSSLTANVEFGTLITDINKNTNSIVANLSQNVGKIYSLSMQESKAYLFGDLIKLSNFDLNFDISDFNIPKISFISKIDFTEFSAYDAYIVKLLGECDMVANISKIGFDATIKGNKSLPPITILDRGSIEKNVKLSFDTEESLSFSISLNQVDSFPKFNLSGISASLDFGDILQSSENEVNGVLSSVKANLELNAEKSSELALNFLDNSTAHLLGTKAVIEGINNGISLDIETKTIKILDLSVNLENYSNPVLKKFTGSKFNASVSPSGFSGSITADGGLDDVVIVNRGGLGKDVVLDIEGTPSLTIAVNENGIDFDFDELDARINFGDTLQASENSVGGTIEPIIATLSSTVNDAKEYTLTFPSTSNAYLLGTNFALNNILAKFSLLNKNITLNSPVDLSSYNNPILSAMKDVSINLELSNEKFEGILSSSGSMEPITILDRGVASNDVRVEFESSPNIKLTILSDSLDFGFSGGNAKLHFGDLLQGAIANLNSKKDDLGNSLKNIYNWSIIGDNNAKKLVSDAALELKSLEGTLDLSNLLSPKVVFNGIADLSKYEGIFSKANNIIIRNFEITKDGLMGSFSPSLGSTTIWEEKAVKLNFITNPTVNINVSRSSFDIGFSNLDLDLDFGTLINETQVRIDDNGWNIDGLKNLANSNIKLNNLSGLVDLSDFSNPTISLNALVSDLKSYSDIFEQVNTAEILNAKISKDGFSSKLIMSLNNIDIWKDKNVKVIFNAQNPPEFSLDIGSLGLHLGIKNLHADLYLGSLLNEATATIQSLEEDTYSWQLEGEHLLEGSQMLLKQLSGNLDLSNLKKPIINLNTNVDLSTYGGILQTLNSVSLDNATISHDGFKGNLNAELSGFDIWREKNVRVIFPSGEFPTLSLKLTRSGFGISLSDLNAQIAFGSLLDGNQLVNLSPLVPAVSSAFNTVNSTYQNVRGTTRNVRNTKVGKLGKEIQKTVNEVKKGIYKWSLTSPHNLTSDSKGYVVVSDMGGTIDLNNILDPTIVFNADANFQNYNLGENISVETVKVDDATISKSGVDWNMYIQGLKADFTILDLGTKNEDVRIELFNVDGTLSSQGTNGIQNADGKLFFGKLFNGNIEPITLEYQNNGHYSFQTDQVFTYSKGENKVVLSGLSGSVKKIGAKYEVDLEGNSEVHATVLSNIGIKDLSISSLKVNDSGFKGDISANLGNKRINIINEKATLILSKVGVHIDSTKIIPFRLSEFDGYIDLAAIFDESISHASAVLTLVDSSINWRINQSLHINEQFVFKNLSGSLNIDSLVNTSISLNGNFGYEGIDDLGIVLNNFNISRTGLSGSILLPEGSSIRIAGVEGLNLTQLSASFFNDNIIGSASINYNKASFLNSGKPLELDLGATISNTGINSFSLKSNISEDIAIPGFANFSFIKVITSPTFDNFYVSLDGLVKPNHDIFKADNGLEFRNLKISKDGLSVDNAGVNFPVSGSSGSLGGFSLSIESLGMGVEADKLYISSKGALSLAGLAEAGAGVKLYSDKTIAVDSIMIDVKNPGASFAGEIIWKKNDPVYGDYFGTGKPLNMRLAELFSLKGEFKVGTHHQKGFFWMAQAQGGLGGGGIPLGPLSIYELGGGAAYNMSFTEVDKGKTKAKNYDFIPSGSNNSVLILSSVLGTPDLGFTWHGQLDVILDSRGQLDINGITYILSAIGSESSNRQIEGRIVLGANPAALQINAAANIKFFGVGLDAPHGAVDILLNESEKHLYLGTSTEAEGFSVSADNPIGIEIFGLDGPSGYFMIDTRQLAFGFGYNFYKKWSLDWYGPDPWASASVWANAGSLMRYNPFYMKMYAGAGVDLKVGYAGLSTTLLAFGLKMELVTPSPNYLWTYAYVEVFDEEFGFSGYVYGSGRGSSAAKTVLLLDHVEPYSNRDISVMPKFDIYTMHSRFSSEIKNLKIVDKSNNRVISLKKDYSNSTEKSLNVFPEHLLQNNQNYELKGLIEYKDREGETFTETFKKEFKTTKENRVEFNEIIKEIYPANNEQGIAGNAPVIITYSDTVKNYDFDNLTRLLGNYEVTIKNSKNESIPGRYEYKKDYNRSYFLPSKELRMYHYCVSSSTGEIKETFRNSNGEYLNPFKNYSIDGDTPNQTIVSIPSNISKKVLSNISVGKFEKSVPDEDTTYSYFSNTTYKIIIRDISSNLIVYTGSYDIQYTNIYDESMRRFEILSDKLDPNVEILSNENPERHEKRFIVNSDLGMMGGDRVRIYYYLKTTWDIEGQGLVSKKTNGADFIKHSNIPGVEFGGNINNLVRASIVYYDEQVGHRVKYKEDGDEGFLLERDISITNGGTYSTAEQEEFAERMSDKLEKASNVEVNVLIPGVNGPESPGVDGSHLGVGNNPIFNSGNMKNIPAVQNFNLGM